MKKGRRRSAQRREPTATKGAGEIFCVLIERLLPGGYGLAHADGRTLLVALAAPGDRARVRVERVRGKVSYASILEIIEPSPVRVAPPCKYFGRCGGCDFQQLSSPAQLSAKVEILRDCLRRIAGIDPPHAIHINPSPQPMQYRARAQWQYDGVRQRLGYFERGSHVVCDVEECPVLVPALQDELTALRGQMAEGALPDEVTEFQAVAGDEGASLSPPLRDAQTRIVSRSIAGHLYRFSADAFFQTNHELLETLVAAALDDARGEMALDLYCGAGLFTLPLAGRFARVVGVEANPQAVAFGHRNLSQAQISNASIVRAGAADWLNALDPDAARADFVLLDPPRTGAETGVIKGLLAMRPHRISYVSCDPATLARDLRELFGGGYTLDSITAFDMFPQTHHVETVAHLRVNPQVLV